MKKVFPKLHTERLNLIEITQSHLRDYYEIFKEEKVTKYYNIMPFGQIEDARKYIDWFQSRYKEGLGIRWGIQIKGDNRIIGTAGFNNFQINHRSNIGYDLHCNYWKKGFVTEALSQIVDYGFNEIGVNRIEAEVMQGNVASERVLQKLGFCREGILRDWAYWNNKHYDMTMFSLLKKDYQSLLATGK